MSSNQFDRFGQLGSLLGEFGWNKRRAKALLIAWSVMFVLSLPLSFVLLGLPGLIMSGYFSYRSFQRLKGAKPIILVYQQGLIDCRKGTPQIIRYEEIKNVFYSVISWSGILNYIVTLETKNLGKVKIDEHVANVDRMRVLIEEQLIQLNLPALIANYQQGNDIEFGHLTLTQEGLLARKRMLPWSEFESADVKRGYKTVEFIIRQKGSKNDWFCYPRDIFPNLALFLAFINYIATTKRQANMP